MIVLFDLEITEVDWTASVNEVLIENDPEYIKKHDFVGTKNWWESYHEGKIPHSIKLGSITFVGKKTDEFGEIFSGIEIDFEDETRTYDQVGFWKTPLLTQGSQIEVESFQINCQTRTGPMLFKFDKKITLISPLESMNT